MPKIQRLAMAGVALGMLVLPATANAIGGPISLGSAASFAVLGSSTVTNTGPTIVTGDLGVSPGSAVTGFPPGVLIGTLSTADPVAAQAQVDLSDAYNNAVGQASDAIIVGDLGGSTLTPGVYSAASSMGLTGTLELDAQGDPDAIWVFQAGSTLTTASASTVSFINGAQACNVFWQIGSSATLGTNSTFGGNILALASITVTTGVTIDGRALAQNGAVTMDSNVITRSDCAAAPEPTPTPTSPPEPTPTPTPTPTPEPTATPTPTPTPTATPAPTPTPTATPAPTPTPTATPAVAPQPVVTQAPIAPVSRRVVGTPAATLPPTGTTDSAVREDESAPTVLAGLMILFALALMVTLGYVKPRRAED